MARAGVLNGHEIGHYVEEEKESGSGSHWLRNTALGLALLGLTAGGYKASRTDWFQEHLHPQTAQAAAGNAARGTELTMDDYVNSINKYVSIANEANGGKEVFHPVTASGIKIEKITKKEMEEIARDQHLSVGDFMKRFNYNYDKTYAIRVDGTSYYGFGVRGMDGIVIHTSGPTPRDMNP